MATLTNAERVAALTGRRRPAAPREEPGLRFAFYGRMSTSTFQDVQTSRAWQRAVSDELIEGVGSVVAEFFDVRVSRRWSWQDRPEAAALLAAAAILIVTSMRSWWGSTSALFLVISSVRSWLG